MREPAIPLLVKVFSLFSNCLLHTPFLKATLFIYLFVQISDSILLFLFSDKDFLSRMTEESGLGSIKSRIFTTHDCLLMLFQMIKTQCLLGYLNRVQKHCFFFPNLQYPK